MTTKTAILSTLLMKRHQLLKTLSQRTMTHVLNYIDVKTSLLQIGERISQVTAYLLVDFFVMILDLLKLLVELVQVILKFRTGSNHFDFFGKIRLIFKRFFFA